MRVAAVQLTAGRDVAANLALAQAAIGEAAEAGARLVVLPEATMACFRTRLADVAEPLDGPFACGIRRAARDAGVVVVVGMFTPGSDGSRVRNTLLVTDGADVEAHYDKVHLYDALGVRESDTVEPGTAPALVVEALGTRIGLATCYDVRFAAWFTELGRSGAEVVCVPASWAGGPGKAEQLELLARARAMDAQAYLVCADQAPPADAGTRPLGVGGSLVAGPLGEVLAAAAKPGPQLVLADLDLGRVASVRAQLPILC